MTRGDNFYYGFICVAYGMLGLDMKIYDVIIIGAGAAGLTAARAALGRNKSVAILEMKNTPARKVAASGGGRCNITNMAAGYNRYFGQNKNFVRSALAQFGPNDILDWTKKHNIKLFEKESGRFFCADGADAVVDALVRDVRGADIFYSTSVVAIGKNGDTFDIVCDDNRVFYAKSVILATGGTSFGALGVSDIGYKIAKSFGHKIIPVRPALCAMAISQWPNDLSGISIPAQITVGKNKINDDLLFTHFGIGGPLAYRASLFDITDDITINLLPNIDLENILCNSKKDNGRKSITNVIAEYLPLRVARWITNNDTRNIADIKNTEIKQITTNITNIKISRDAIKYHNMQSAEVVRGGVSTDEISSKTMESKLCANLFIVGELMDIAGDLGGFNLQWAWASGYVAGINA